VVTIESSPGARISVGEQPYEKDRLNALRREHSMNYLFKRGGEEGDSILSVALKGGFEPLGDDLKEYLLARALATSTTDSGSLTRLL
jgi:hypothetical protein